MKDQNGDKTRTRIVLTKGMMVSHYRIVEKIGSGGMGEVYLAEDTKLDRKVALKFLPSHLCQDEDCRARFKREAQAVAKLNHPNIVTIFEVSEYNDRPFFAMELIEGRSLRELAAEKDLRFDRILELAIQICDGLRAAHEKKVVHRDIKPSNIVIDAYGRPKILDFGLAAIQGGEHLTKTGSTLGTIRYMSPEQVDGETVDHRSDLFSLGIVLYELITGRTPFERDNEAATLKSIGQDAPEPLERYKSEIPDELQRIVSKLLEKDPSTRYQSTAGVISDLKPLVTSTRGSMTGVATRQRNRWPLAVGGLIVFVVLLVAGIKYWPGSETAHPVTATQGRMMLAILPFENLGDPADEYFADGITDEITSRVAVLKGLGVIARTSILQYKGTKKRINEIGAELNVDYILEGTIRWDKSGNVDKVRITPQLIRVSDETHLWADNYQRDLSEIFEVQEEIATSIAGALNVALLTGDHEALNYRPTNNLNAYDYYLRAKNYLAQGNDADNYLSAIRLLEEAIKLDSTFAEAFAWKAHSHVTYAWYYEFGASEHTRPARLAYQRAFELQPNLADAFLARGTYINYIERDYDGALQDFQRARQGKIDEALILSEITIVKMRQGNWNEALAMSRQVTKLDPRSIPAAMLVIWPLWYTHQYGEAHEILDRMIDLAPDEATPYWMKTMIQINIGADAEKIDQTLAEWSRHLAEKDILLGIGGVTYLGFFRFGMEFAALDAELSRVKSRLNKDSDPIQFFYTGLLYRFSGETDSSYLYLDSMRILIESRVAQARSDSSGRFEYIAVEHNVYELLALSYSLTNRHEKAIEQAQLATETMPIESCYW